MKITHLISASLIAGAVLLSSSACAQPAPAPDTAPISSSSEPAATEEFVASQDDIDAVANTMNGYYGFMAQSDSRKKIKDAVATWKAEEGAEYQKLVDSFPEGFKYFDTSTDEAIDNAYKAMMLGSSTSVDRPGMEITAPTEGVTVLDKTTATFNTTWLELVEEGKTYDVVPEENPEPSHLVTLTKTEAGSWVIVAKSVSSRATAP